MRAAVSVLAFLLLASPLAGAKVHEIKVFIEVEETGVSGLGQRNCAAEALYHLPSSECPVIDEPKFHPKRSIRMLDSVYTLMPGVEGYYSTVRDVTNEDSGTPSNHQGTNPRRQTNGVVADVIYPGLAQFEGWYGHFFDENSDGIAQFRRGKTSVPSEYPPDNEWHPRLGGTMMSFIEPGSHPSYGARTRPTRNEPDIVYSSSMTGTYGAWAHADGLRSDGLVLFLDGSLFITVRVETVVDPLLAPDPAGRFPFTLTERSLLDIDLYAALATGPIAEIYEATVGDSVTAVGSPSMGLCPSGCRLSPVPLGGTPAEAVLAPTYASFFAKYPQEWRVGERSVASGFKELYSEDFAPWADLRPYWSPLSAVNENASVLRPGPVPGRGEHGGMAVLPGILSFELRTGLWYDKNGDGVVGVGYEGDPYQSGTRPDPDDYVNAAGEFIGHNVVRTATSTFESYGLPVTLRPLDTWGLAGVFIGAPPSLTGTGGPTITCQASNCVRDPATYWIRGSDAVHLTAYRDSQERGRYTVSSVLMPFGTRDGGFEACTDVAYLRYASEGFERREPVWDCDVIERLAEADASATP